MTKIIGKTIHEAQKFSQLQWALASLAPCFFFHKSFKINMFICLYDEISLYDEKQTDKQTKIKFSYGWII